MRQISVCDYTRRSPHLPPDGSTSVVAIELGFCATLEIGLSSFNVYQVSVEQSVNNGDSSYKVTWPVVLKTFT